MPIVKRKIVENKVSSEQVIKRINLKEFYEKKDKILIFRGCGGLGDILMHRMMFEDFKTLAPDLKIHFACPKYYHDAVKDHPFIDEVLDSETVNKKDYLVHYNTTSACGRTEMRNSPNPSIHRSDIWANYCGLNLKNHEMHITLSELEKNEGKEIIEKNRDTNGLSVAICPISAMENKNLQPEQLNDLVNKIRESGFYPFVLNDKPVNICFKNNIPMILENRLRIWMGILNQADFIISVDTASFHCAGGMKKPTLGLFTFVNGKSYSQYYPKVEFVQGLCPVGHKGCYNWGSCPCKFSKLVPCCSNLTSSLIFNSFIKLTIREE